jgi:acetamidase/formamidase
MTVHALGPEPGTVHGSFSRELPPVLSIDPGDTVRLRTLDAGWGLEPPTAWDAPRRYFEPRDAERDRGHALCGPLEVRGARPGMTLEVRIDAVHPGAWGWTRAGGWRTPLNERLGVADGDQHLLVWTIDAGAATARNQHGDVVPVRPFMGVMGMPPDEPGRHSTFPPRLCGGNIDCKELVAGSTLWLPVPVAGALFSVGDGHAAQGDGEACGQAIECPMERVELTFGLRTDFPLATPAAETPAGWVTFGFHEDVDEAAALALGAMLDLLGARHGLTRKRALGLASVLVDVRITQLVNGVRGAHAVLPRGTVPPTPWPASA